LNINVQYGSK